MRNRWNAPCVRAGVLSLGLVAFACAPDSSSTVYDDGSAPPPATGLYVALGNVANANDAAAFKLLAHAPGKDVDPASVKFCFDTKEICGNGEGESISAAAVEVQGRQVFVSEKYVKLRHDLRLTVVAKDKDGTDLTTGVTIVGKGRQPTSSQPASSTATGTATATATSSATATSTATAPGTATGTGAGSGPTGSKCYKAPSEFVCQVELEIARLTSEKRQNSGFAPVAYDARVAYVSRLWSEEQARTGMISHEWFSNGTLKQRYSAEFNEEAPIVSENVAMNLIGSDATQVASAFVEQWWNSEGHKANMLSPNVNIIGVGYAGGAGGGAYATQNFGRR
jgi:uncharacterized protein YkwD